jgi:hypothetical protein
MNDWNTRVRRTDDDRNCNGLGAVSVVDRPA